MQKLKDWTELFCGWCVVSGIVWSVYNLSHGIAAITVELSAIEQKLPDPRQPSLVTVSGLPVLADALKPCKSEKHK